MSPHASPGIKRFLEEAGDTAELSWEWADELQAPPEPEWIWRGYIAPGAVTLLAGKPKAARARSRAR
jgi:hypothetical protein